MASSSPAVCPTCSTPIPAGRAQCPGCKKVFGEDNRCETCNAVAGVFARGGGYVCAACSAPRNLLPGTLVLGGDRPSSLVPAAPRSVRPSAAPPATALVARAGATGLRLFGGAAMGGGALGVALGLLVLGGTFGWFVGAVGLVGAVFGVLAWRAGGRQSASAASEERAARERAVWALAEQSGGILTVTQVAQALGWSAGAADALLTGMADGTRVTVEVDDEGLLSWHFREIMRRAGPRVRVSDEAAQPDEAPAAAQSAAASLGRAQKP
jgi:hypothetical protein